MRPRYWGWKQHGKYSITPAKKETSLRNSQQSKRIARNEQGPTANPMPAHTISRDVLMRASGSSHRLHQRPIAGHVEGHVGDAEQSGAEAAEVGLMSLFICAAANPH